MEECLTFHNVVHKYCKYLGEVKSDGLEELVEALKTHARVKEPLLIYAVLSNQTQKLLEADLRDDIKQEYKIILKAMKEFDCIEDYLASGEAPKRYNSVYCVGLQKVKDNSKK